MRPLPRAALTRLATSSRAASELPFLRRYLFHYAQRSWLPPVCSFSTVAFRAQESEKSINATPSSRLNNNVTQQEKDHFDQQVIEDKEKQVRTPWHRADSDKPPVARNRSAGAMTKGKLLTTPSRMLKLVLPLTTKDANTDRKDVEPLALLIHPQQPLSYLERLIQSELPMLEDKDGRSKVPAVWFRAEDSKQESLDSSKVSAASEHNDSKDGEYEEKQKNEDKDEDDKEEQEDEEEAQHRRDREREKDRKAKDRARESETKEKDEKGVENPDEVNIDGVVHRTGKLNKHSPSEAAQMRGGPGEGGIEVYSGLGQSRPSVSGKDDDGDSGEPRFVRWSNSTEIGDFIRDAARGREFAVEIEGAPAEIRVGVPSFLDRTFYLRMRLRGLSRKISSMASLKRECDAIAHRSAQRVALGGFGILCGWWYVVYRLTFETDLGWDVMEPVTYLVGLSTLIGGYIWFLWHNREVSYKSAMNLTISRRQSKLYEQRGFDAARWQALVDEGNALRHEIRGVADSYDVQWDEAEDEGDEKVREALRKDREEKRQKGKGKSEKDDD